MIAALLMLVAPAAASHGSVVWFLADGDSAVAGKHMSAEAPDGSGSVAVIIPTEASWLQNRFLAPQEVPEGRIVGPVMAGLWLDEVPQIPGKIDVVLLEVRGDTMTALARASVDIGRNLPPPPEPTSLLPSDPSDPERAAY
jgi:hypothetical protein